MPANYLRAICLSMIIWINQQSSNLWSSDMPERLYYDRILSMTAWKVNHLDRSLKELISIRKRMRKTLKCRNKPNLKSCQTYQIALIQKSLLEEYLFKYPVPKKWIHWSVPEGIDEYLATCTNLEIEKFLKGESKFLSHLDPNIVIMHAMSEKLARYLKQKYPTYPFTLLSDIPWWYFLILFLFVLLNISLCNNYNLTADKQNER